MVRSLCLAGWTVNCFFFSFWSWQGHTFQQWQSPQEKFACSCLLASGNMKKPPTLWCWWTRAHWKDERSFCLLCCSTSSQLGPIHTVLFMSSRNLWGFGLPWPPDHVAGWSYHSGRVFQHIWAEVMWPACHLTGFCGWLRAMPSWVVINSWDDSK